MQEQEKQYEQKYLKSFLQDINYDIPELEEAIKYDSLWLVRTQPLLTAIMNKEISVDSAESMIKLITTISKIDANTSTTRKYQIAVT